MTSLNRFLSCAASTLTSSHSKGVTPSPDPVHCHSSPLNNDSMHVCSPMNETDASILSSNVHSEGSQVSSAFVESDSYFVPTVAFFDFVSPNDDDILDNDPYLEPLSSLQSRLDSSETNTIHPEEAFRFNRGTFKGLSQPSRGLESLKCPLPLISIPKIVTLARENSADYDDNLSQCISEESAIIPVINVNDSPPKFDCDTSQIIHRIRDLKKAIQHSLQQNVLRHIQTMDGLSPCQSTSVERPKSSVTASLYMELGLLEQKQRSYSAAIQAFFHAATLYRNNGNQEDILELACSLDSAVVTFCLALQEEGATNWMHHPLFKVSRFFLCIHEAVRIRKQELGTSHDYTLEAIHHLGQLCVLTGEPGRAVPHFIEAIQQHVVTFGPHHSNTAVMAQDLGNAYLQCQDIASAQKWYQYAGRIHEGGKSPVTNVQSLWRAKKRLERIHRWTQEDPAHDENLLFEL